MPSYSYIALNEIGDEVRGDLNAPDERAARARVREQGLFLTSLEEKQESILVAQRGVSDRDLAAVTRLFGTLLQAGFPVVDALATLGNQSANPYLSRVLEDVRTRVQEGGKLSQALEAHNNIFPELYVHMVRAGETGSALQTVLLELAEYLEKRSKVRNKLYAALAYPMVMTIVGMVMLGFLVSWVVPTMAELLAAGEKELPLITKALMFFGNLLIQWWWTIPFLVFGASVAARMVMATETGVARVHYLALRTPALGDLVHKMIMARFARLFGVLLKSGVPILQALEIVEGVVGNVHIRAALVRARVEVAKGANLSEPLRQSGWFPPLVVDMVGAGQRAGKLTETLDRLSEGYDSEVEAAIETFMALLEPVLIIVMAVAVGFVVAGVLLPIFEMNDMQGF